MKRHSRLRILSYLMATVLLLTSFTGWMTTAKAKDVSGLAKVRLMSFSVGNQSIISNGVLQDGYSEPIEITSETEYRLEYEFSIADQDLGGIQKGDTLTVTMPAWLKHQKQMTSISEFASYSVEGNQITITFSKDLKEYHSAKGGFSFWAKNENTEETQTVSIDYAENQSVSIELKKKPEGSGGSGGGTTNTNPGHPDNFKPNKNKSVFLKEGKIEGNKSDGRIFYTFSVNYSELQKIYKTGSDPIKAKQNVVLVDELPKEWEHSNDMEFDDIMIEAPLYPPSTENGGTVTNQLSENKIDRYFAYRVNNGNKEGIFDLIQKNGDNTKESWNAFKTEIAQKSTPTIGVWNKTKIVINFGKLPFEEENTYGKLMYQFDDTLNDYAKKTTALTTEQINKMKAAYRDQGLVAFDVTVYVKVLNYTANTPGGDRVYDNDATLTWSEGETTAHSNPVYVKGSEAWFQALPNKKRDILIKKQWYPSTPDTGTRITVDLMKDKTGNGKTADDERVRKNIEISGNNGWQTTVTALPKYESSGAEIHYYVQEKEVSGFKTSYRDIYENGEFKGFLITNTKETTPPQTEQKMNLGVEKRWENVPVEQQPESLEFVLKKKIDSTTEVVEEFTLKAETGWKWQKENLPKLENEKEIDYFVEEKNAGAYTVEYKETADSSGNQTIVVTNKKKESPPITPEDPKKTESVILTAEKKWEGIDSSEAPFVTVGLYKDGVATNSTVTLNAENGWRASFEKLPAKENEKEIRYTLKEENIPEGFTVSEQISGLTKEESNTEVVRKQTYIFTNKKNSEEPKKNEKIHIAVQKDWVGLGENENVPAASFELMKNGTKVDELKLTKDEPIGIFKDLDQYDESGKLIDYSVNEQKVEGFSESHTVTKNQKITINGAELLVTYYQFKNTKDSVQHIQLNVEKQWAGGSEESVTFILRKNGQDTDRSITLNAANNWKGSFGLLPRIENGEKVDYDIKEKTISGYNVSYQRRTGDTTVNGEAVEFKNILVINTKVPSSGTPNIIIPIDPNPLIPLDNPDYPTFIPPEIPKEVEEFLLEDEDVVRASAEEEPKEEKNEDFEVNDDLPKANKHLPKTHDLIGGGFANPLAVGTLLMMGYGVKKLFEKKEKKGIESKTNG